METRTIEVISDFNSTIFTALATMVICGAIAAYLIYGKNLSSNKRMRQIAAMLMFYGALISAGVAGFSYWQDAKTIDLVFEASGVETPYGFLKYTNVEQAKIQTETVASFANPNMVRSKTNLLVITETGGKAHVLSEENYPVREVLGELKKRTAKK